MRHSSGTTPGSHTQIVHIFDDGDEDHYFDQVLEAASAEAQVVTAGNAITTVWSAVTTGMLPTASKDQRMRALSTARGRAHQTRSRPAAVRTTTTTAVATASDVTARVLGFDGVYFEDEHEEAEIDQARVWSKAQQALALAICVAELLTKGGAAGGRRAAPAPGPSQDEDEAEHLEESGWSDADPPVPAADAASEVARSPPAHQP